MEVSLAVLADCANITKENKLNILGIFDVVRAKTFPATHPNMQLVITLEAYGSEVDTSKKILVKLMDPDGGKVLEVGGEISLSGKVITGESAKSSQILKFNNVVFQKPGNFAFSILINGDEKARVPLKVVQM